MIQYQLKNFKGIPDSGIAIFCGRINQKIKGQPDEICQIIEPPLPIKRCNYFCDKRFHTELVADLYKKHKQIGYVILTSVEVILLTVEGTQRTVVYKRKTDIATDSRRGGSSSNRIARCRKEKKSNYLTVIKDAIVDKLNQTSGIIISGNGELPSEICKELKGDSRLLVQVLGVVKIDLGGNIIENSVIKGYEIMYEDDVRKEKRHVETVRKLIELEPDKCVFGKNEVSDCLDNAVIKTLYITSDLIDKYKGYGEDCDIIEFKFVDYLAAFGGVIGVLYFAQQTGFDFDE